MGTQTYHAYVDCENMTGYRVAPKGTYHDYICFEVELSGMTDLNEVQVSVALDEKARSKVFQLAKQQFAPLLEHMPIDKLYWSWTRDINVFTLTCRIELPTLNNPNLAYVLFSISLVEDRHKAQLFEDIPEHVKQEHNIEI